jgi:metallo-beta-lactamase family protein
VDTDFLVMECTYGDTSHPDPEIAYNQLQQVVRRTLERHGKVIIPAFAIGRTQELVYELNRLMSNGDIPRVPVFVDSPLAVEASDIFSEHPDYFDEETQAFIHSAKGRSALGFGLLTYTRSAEESKALNNRKDPMIIISASGMAENGRILHHLKHNIGDARNTILIVGWQAPDTLGRRLVEGEKRVKIFGEFYERRAEVVTINGYSAHAGQEFLLEYALAARESTKEIFLVHGEVESAEALRQNIIATGFDKITYPELHQTVEL